MDSGTSWSMDGQRGVAGDFSDIVGKAFHPCYQLLDLTVHTVGTRPIHKFSNGHAAGFSRPRGEFTNLGVAAACCSTDRTVFRFTAVR